MASQSAIAQCRGSYTRVQTTLCRGTAGEEEGINVWDATIAIHDDGTNKRPADNVCIWSCCKHTSRVALSAKHTVQCYEVGVRLERLEPRRRVLLQTRDQGQPGAEHDCLWTLGKRGRNEGGGDWSEAEELELGSPPSNPNIKKGY